MKFNYTFLFWYHSAITTKSVSVILTNSLGRIPPCVSASPAATLCGVMENLQLENKTSLD